MSTKPEERDAPKPDRLAIMLNMQRELQEKSFKTDFEAMSQEHRMQFIKDMHTALTMELGEALDETGWKPWASSNHINTAAFKGELVDAWHFFMNLMLVVDMDAEELFEGYMRKHQVNVTRQKEGYDGVSGKCKGCKRAFDDEAVKCHRSEVHEGGSCCHYNRPEGALFV
jgi:hypothetical protein